MTLVGFKIENHPQQVAKRGAKDTVDERITPQWLFDELDAQWGFTLDVAANAKNTKCERFYSLDADGLENSWAGERVWCNPPYSNIKDWVAKARAEVANGCPLAVLLLPANRTEQKWWQEHIEPFRDQPGSGVSVRFLARRINFGVPGNEAAKFHSSPPFGLAIVTFTSSEAEGTAPDLLAALKAIMSAEIHPLHVGYDNGSGGGNYVYADAIRTDSEAFHLARAAIAAAEAQP